VEGKWIHYYVHARLVLSYLVDIGIMFNLVIFFVFLPISLAISGTNIAGFDHFKLCLFIVELHILWVNGPLKYSPCRL
jgi:hypothetical protein